MIGIEYLVLRHSKTLNAMTHDDKYYAVVNDGNNVNDCDSDDDDNDHDHDGGDDHDGDDDDDDT